MKLADYPRFTVIMRGYTFDQADAILQAMQEFDHQFAVEMTMNTEGAIDHIRELNKRYGDTTYIGAGTVRTLEQAKACYEAGAKFLLGPHMFTEEMLAYANEKGVLAVPAAMTPSEVNQMFAQGADIVKVFPAAVVTPRFFKDIQAPLGKLPLMGVGGISKENAKEFFENGASYLGLGSGMFNKQDIEELNVKNLAQSMKELLGDIQVKYEQGVESMELYLNEELVFRNVEASTDSEVLAYLAGELYQKGYVKEEYIQAIQDREKEYPTGLPSTPPGIAIPHANYEMVNKTTLAIATLKEPVLFHNMEDNKAQLPIQIVIMMAIGEPHGQVEMLQKIVGIIQDEPLRQEMIDARNDTELLALLKKAVF